MSDLPDNVVYALQRAVTQLFSGGEMDGPEMRPVEPIARSVSTMCLRARLTDPRDRTMDKKRNWRVGEQIACYGAIQGQDFEAIGTVTELHGTRMTVKFFDGSEASFPQDSPVFTKPPDPDPKYSVAEILAKFRDV